LLIVITTHRCTQQTHSDTETSDTTQMCLRRLLAAVAWFYAQYFFKFSVVTCTVQSYILYLYLLLLTSSICSCSPCACGLLGHSVFERRFSRKFHMIMNQACRRLPRDVLLALSGRRDTCALQPGVRDVISRFRLLSFGRTFSSTCVWATTRIVIHQPYFPSWGNSHYNWLSPSVYIRRSQ
jgi:hypothetical protein